MFSGPEHPSLLSYWAAAKPSDAKWFRIAFFQPLFGILFVIAGLAMVALAVIQRSIGWGIAAGVLLVLGVILAGTAYGISVNYFHEYPGGFGAYLEEYVARRVSRLSRKDFIPSYKAKDAAEVRTMRVMNNRVSLALQGELLRLEQSEHAGEPEVCGVMVVGPKHSNKTGALWDAMKLHLREWTFVRWPHHMDYPPDLASHLGHRIVLWLDDLHDFANLGEAAALDQFLQQLRDEHRRFVVLSSCRDRDGEQAAKRYFLPLFETLRRVPAPISLTLATQSEDLRQKYNDLSESQQSVLGTIDWLESIQVNTFPWEALTVLSTGFISPDATLSSSEETLQRLANDSARFVQVNRRADPRTQLEDERYDFWRWFRYTFFPRHYTRRRRNDQSEDVHSVLEPINVNNLALIGSREARAATITSPATASPATTNTTGTSPGTTATTPSSTPTSTSSTVPTVTTNPLQGMAYTLERYPEVSIQQLTRSPFAAELLILLGDAYLYRLDETIENAGKLAVLCYDGALDALKRDHFADQFPGAWAAAHIGKGNAALRARKRSDNTDERVDKLTEASLEYGTVTERAKLPNVPGARPIPRMSYAHAWHGQGDAIAADIPSEMVMTNASAGAQIRLAEAATYFANAAAEFPPGDPLRNEARLDRANVLYVSARAAARDHRESLTNTASPAASALPPIAAITDARDACLEVQSTYGKELAPAVWAELQRRLGDLCLMELEWFVPMSMRPHLKYPEAAMRMLASQESEQNARETAKSARDYFIEASDVFAPSYMLMSWLRAQIGLIRAQVTVARLLEMDEPNAAKDLYILGLVTIDAAVRQIDKVGYSPFDWVDLQVLRAQGEIGIGRLEPVTASSRFDAAKDRLKDVTNFLSGYLVLELLKNETAPKRLQAQLDEARALMAELEKAPPGS